MFDDFCLKLFKAQNECALSWITQDGSPASTVVSFVYKDDAIWMTALTGSARLRAVMRDNRVAVVVSGSGSKIGNTRCVSMRGEAEVIHDQEVKDWFFPEFSKAVLRKSWTGAKMMSSSMNNASNAVIKFTPDKIIPYDAQKMMKLANFMP